MDDVRKCRYCERPAEEKNYSKCYECRPYQPREKGDEKGDNADDIGMDENETQTTARNRLFAGTTAPTTPKRQRPPGLGNCSSGDDNDDDDSGSESEDSTSSDSSSCSAFSSESTKKKNGKGKKKAAHKKKTARTAPRVPKKPRHKDLPSSTDRVGRATGRGRAAGRGRGRGRGRGDAIRNRRIARETAEAEVLTLLRYLLPGERVEKLKNHKLYSSLVNPQPLGNAARWTLQEVHLTIERNGRDCPDSYFDQIQEFVAAVGCFEAAWNTERGKIKHHRHHHLMMKIFAPAGAAGLLMVRHAVMSFFGNEQEPCRRTPGGYDIDARFLEAPQTFDMMCGGYLCKDAGEQHFALGLVSLSHSRLYLGKLAWQKRKMSYNNTGINVTRSNVFEKVYFVYNKFFKPLHRMSFLQALRFLLLWPEDKHIISPEWAKNGSREWHHGITELIFSSTRTVPELLSSVIRIPFVAWVFFRMKPDDGVSQRCDNYLTGYASRMVMGAPRYSHTDLDSNGSTLEATQDAMVNGAPASGSSSGGSTSNGSTSSNSGTGSGSSGSSSSADASGSTTPAFTIDTGGFSRGLPDYAYLDMNADFVPLQEGSRTLYCLPMQHLADPRYDDMSFEQAVQEAIEASPDTSDMSAPPNCSELTTPTPTIIARNGIVDWNAVIANAEQDRLNAEGPGGGGAALDVAEVENVIVETDAAADTELEEVDVTTVNSNDVVQQPQQPEVENDIIDTDDAEAASQAIESESAKCDVSPLSNSEDEQGKAERGGSGLDSDDVGDV